MSSSDSTVTHTSVSSEDLPFWGIRFFGMEQPDSPKVASQSPIQTQPIPQNEDEREPMFIQPHDHDYVPGPVYPEYIPLEDEHSNPEEDPEEYEDDETKDGPVDYPMDEKDDGDDDEGDSSRDEANDEDEDEEDEEEEEEHLAPADSAIVIPTDELVSPPEGTEPVAFCPGVRFVLDCVLSSTAFCSFEDQLLRFTKDKLRQTQNCIAFCLRLRFASEDCVLKNLAFCLRSVVV
nr:hypothetical protein [Tanacetum cinerariifolium]